MLKRYLHPLNRNLALAALLFAAVGLAQDGPISINADKAELTEVSGESIYIGNVDLSRGDLVMNGDRLKVTRNAKTGEVRAILVGRPATITQPDRKTGNPITAKADQIDYYSNDEVLVMKGNAQVIRGAERMQGERIRYYAATQKVIADESRIKIVIDPSQHSSSAQQ